MHKILIADDEPEILSMIEDTLSSKLSCETIKITNGLDAFIQTQKEKFDLIITDQNMPFMKGSAFIIGVRTKENQNKLTPILMLSGFIDQKIKDSLHMLSVEFLDKPFKNAELIEKIRDILI